MMALPRFTLSYNCCSAPQSVIRYRVTGEVQGKSLKQRAMTLVIRGTKSIVLSAAGPRHMHWLSFTRWSPKDGTGWLITKLTGLGMV